MITKEKDLLELVEKTRQTDAIAIDTEFLWTKTYYPRLGLIQIGLSDEECYLIDPRAINDLSPVGELLADQGVIKIFHDAPSDLAILQRATKTVAKNIFDTRLAAGFAGLPSTLSLSNLIETLLDIQLPKTETRTNWLKRPLDKEQIEYAMDDVRYLRAARIVLVNRIIGPEIKSWLQEELDNLNQPLTYNGGSEYSRYKKIRGTKSLDGENLAILRELVYWREQTAKKLDRPRSHVIKDSDLVIIAKRQLCEPQEILKNTSISPRTLDRWGSALIKYVQLGQKIPEGKRPTVDRPIRLNKNDTQRFERLGEFIALKSSVQGIDPQLIGNNAELKQLIKVLNRSGSTRLLRQMTGWRKLFLKDFFRYSS